MKIKSKYYTPKQLERLFAEDFSSPIFPILADYYFNASQFKKAQKVCQLGLENSSNNLTGQYVLAKTYIMNNKFLKAEKLLKHIVSFDQCNTVAIITLIKIETLLKRSPKTINEYILKAYAKIPNNKKIKKLYYTLQKDNNSKLINNSKKEYNFKRYTKPIKLTKQLATKTMYNILINQKKYNEAKQILRFMELNNKNKVFIKKEKKKLLKLKNIKG